MSVISGVSWQLRIAAKLMLSRLPLAYGAWRRLGLFRHGAMASPCYARGVTESHLRRYEERRGEMPCGVLELGPGDSLLSAVVCAAYGCEPIWLVDASDFAEVDERLWTALAADLHSSGVPAPSPALGDGREDMLLRCKARYGVRGIHSLAEIDDGSLELVWSQAVLEHLPRAEFAAYMGETRRVLSGRGLASHRVDLRDHLGGALNNLRFSEPTWESRLMSGAGFYTNRIRYSEMLDVFSDAGFEVEVLSVDRWPELPTPRRKMAKEFRSIDEDDLRVSGFDVVLHPR